MGADNLVQLPQWRDWREIARLMPTAVIARPGYNDRAHARRAMGWLRRFVRPADQKKHWTDWRPPALENGRASCRARVCQYVSISVVDVSLKKKERSNTSPHFVTFNTAYVYLLHRRSFKHCSLQT